MEVIRKFVDADNLMSFMTLPEAFRNRKLEILVLPVDETESATHEGNISDIVQSLIGAVPHTNLTLEELREERLRKYETSY